MQTKNKVGHPKGMAAWNKGLRDIYSLETKKKMSAAHFREANYNWKGIKDLPLKERPSYEKLKIRNRDLARQRRVIVLRKYGGNPPKCTCCGESIIQFLSIDHINGGGNKHRKELGIGKQIYPWLIKNNFPSGFQVLCHNCNLAKGFYGVCPHTMV